MCEIRAVCLKARFDGPASAASNDLWLSGGFLKQVSCPAARRINHLQADYVIPVGINRARSQLMGNSKMDA